MPQSMEASFGAALLNVFSAACKPLDTQLLLRALKQRFQVRRFVARTRGPDGLFRPDQPDSFVLHDLDADMKVRPLGDSVHVLQLR